MGENPPPFARLRNDACFQAPMAFDPVSVASCLCFELGIRNNSSIM